MEVGYFAVGIGPTADPERVRTVATNAERLGFSTVWAPEHVVLLDEYTSKYPYSSGKFPAPPAQALGDRPLRHCLLAYRSRKTFRIWRIDSLSAGIPSPRFEQMDKPTLG